MSYANIHRPERNLADLQVSPIEVPADDEKPPMPTEGIRGIAAIIGKAVDFMTALAAAAQSSPIQLGNVVTGNNATTPPPSQRVSGLNAGQLAGIEPSLNRAAAPAASNSKGAEKGNPSSAETSKPEPKPNATASAPKAAPYRDSDGVLEPAWKDEPAKKTEIKTTKKKAIATPQPHAKLNSNETTEKATREWEEPAKIKIAPASDFEIETNVPDITIKQE